MAGGLCDAADAAHVVEVGLGKRTFRLVPHASGARLDVAEFALRESRGMRHAGEGDEKANARIFGVSETEWTNLGVAVGKKFLDGTGRPRN